VKLAPESAAMMADTGAANGNRVETVAEVVEEAAVAQGQ
jgi:hypothetical protein